MAKSVLLLVVLAIAVSLHAAHMATAFTFTGDMAKSWTKSLKTATSVVKATAAGIKFQNKQDGEEKSAIGGQGTGSTPLIPNAQRDYIGVTAIKVGDSTTLQMGSMLRINPEDGTGGVLVSNNFQLTFLNSDAYKQLLPKISNGRAVVTSELGADVNQPCYDYESDTMLPSITLVFDGGDEMKVEADKCWYKQSGGSMCLAIVPSPLSTGETIIGTTLQTGMSADMDTDTWTFTSTKDGTGSGTPSMSMSRTAAAMKPFLGAWVLLLLTMLAYI